MTEPVIVVGAGLAGWTTVRELRKHDAHTPIVVITADDGDFYAKPSLSNALAQGKTPAQLVSTPAARMVETLKVTLLPRTRVERIDTAARSLITSRGSFGYRRLVLATGAQPLRLTLAGDAADAVLSVNHLDDLARLHAALRPNAKVLIMGAGLIGCEFANDLAVAGHPVTVVDPAPRALAALLPPEASQALADALAPLGVRFCLGRGVQSLHRAGDAFDAQLSPAKGSDANDDREGAASGHQTLTADVVLSAVGLRPDIALAQAAGIACERGIVVDAHLRTSVPGVFALGDNAQYAGGLTLPYVMPIMHAARVLGAVLAHELSGIAADTVPPLVFPLMPVAVKTPALPLVVAPPPPGLAGRWSQPEPGLWRFSDEGRARGFVLAGGQTTRRSEQARLIEA